MTRRGSLRLAPVLGVQRQLHIAGTGSFAAEIADWAAAAGTAVLGLIEMRDPARVGGRVHGLPVVALDDVRSAGEAVLGLGGDRAAAWERAAAAGWECTAPLIHRAAVVAADAISAPGATIGPLAVIGASSSVGPHAIVSRGALIGHHVRIGQFATLNPGVNVGGNSTIGHGAFIGMGAAVVNGTHVGAGAIVAAGALVIGDVAPGERVQGVPAQSVPTRPTARAGGHS